jgi:hypothetical protein
MRRPAELLDKPHTRKPRWGNVRLLDRRYGDLIAADDAPERRRDDPVHWPAAMRLRSKSSLASNDADCFAI